MQRAFTEMRCRSGLVICMLSSQGMRSDAAAGFAMLVMWLCTTMVVCIDHDSQPVLRSWCIRVLVMVAGVLVVVAGSLDRWRRCS